MHRTVRAVALAVLVVAAAGAAERVACVGDSITQGHGVSDQAQNYPNTLGRLLGAGYEVKNCGKSGTTLLKAGDNPYWKQPEFAAADAFAPTIVLIMLGTNDSKPQNWAKKDGFAADLTALVEHFRALPSKPTVYVCLPPTVARTNFGIREEIIAAEEIPVITATAKTLKAPLIDMHAATAGHADWFPDGVHPNADGMKALATAAAAALTAPAKR